MARAGNNHKGGRPRGKKSPKTLEREKIAEEMRQRIMRLASRLLDKQLVLANGQQFLFKIVKEKIMGPKGGVSYKPKKPELVTDEKEIRDYLENQVDLANGDMEDDKDPGATYYFLTVKEPDGHSIEAMFDRTFGRPVQATKLVDDEGKAVPLTSINVVPISGKVG